MVIEKTRGNPYQVLALAASAVIIALSCVIVWNARSESRQLAEASVLNTAGVLAQQIESSLDNINTQLMIVAERYRDRQRKTPQEITRLNKQLADELHLYEVALRVVVTNQAGEQMFNSASTRENGKNLPSLADREFFQRAKAGEKGLIFQGPIQAKLDQTWSIMMARRITGRQGDFQGVAVVVVPTEALGQSFDKIDLGPNGILNLRTDDLAQVVRRPQLTGEARGIGNRNVSQTLLNLIERQPNVHQHVYRAVAPIDGSERIYAVKKFHHSPFWMTVGRSTEDFEAVWKNTAFLLFLSSTVIIAGLILGARRLNLQHLYVEKLVDQRTQALKNSQERLKRAQAVAKIGSWSLESDHATFSISQETARLFGLEDKEITSQEIWFSRVHPDDQAKVAAAWQAALGGAGFDMTYRIVLPDTMRWIRALAEIEFDAAGHLLRGVGTVQDVTERVETELRLAEAKESAEAANRAKSAFLANMSHELRTPMNGVLGMANLIRRGGLTPKQADQLDKLDLAGRHLVEVINAILDLSKIEAGKIALEETDLSLDAITADIAAILGPSIEVKGLALSIENQSLPYTLLGDATRLKQALMNYLSNAVKFTEQGHIILRTRVEEESPTSALLRFEVEDSGIGIAADVADKLFQAFEQADSSTTRKYGGTGLGLVITRRLAELMGGSAGVRSTEGAGSTFWFTARLQKSLGTTVAL